MAPATVSKSEFKSNGVNNTLKHTRGVLSMARSADLDSAGSQFFIMVADADYLDGQYAAFGKVTSGLDVVDAIVNSKRDSNDKPIKPATMKKSLWIRWVKISSSSQSKVRHQISLSKRDNSNDLVHTHEVVFAYPLMLSKLLSL